jgi:hypothetical protein
MFVKKYNPKKKERKSLSKDSVYELNQQIKDQEYVHSKTNDNGWTINAKIHNNFYKPINFFIAIHPTYGEVWGDFEKTIYASTPLAYQKLVESDLIAHWDFEST